MSAEVQVREFGLETLALVEVKFEQWLDEAVDFDARGLRITRRMQMLLTDNPNVCHHWAKVGFMFGIKRAEGITRDVEDHDRRNTGNNGQSVSGPVL